MAKKSNKTEHVLKLITKNDETAQDDGFFVIDQEISENGTSAVRNAVRDKPEIVAEIVSEIIPEIAPAEKGEEEPEKQAIKDPVIAPVPTVKEMPADPPVKEISVVPPLKSHGDVPEPEEKEPPTIKAFREQESAGSALLEQSDDLVNIAEVLTREKLALVMERMKVCTCKTCVNDVLALALNSLPTKYVTTDAGKQYFQLDIYKKQYETDILAALTKACVRVKAAPRH